jgi:xenotropic and polytropic retrovirus receptor 1
MERLRAEDKSDEHVEAVFHNGLLLGLAIPFLLGGIIASLQDSTRQAIPEAEMLLQVWGGLGLILLFLLLFGINAWVWQKTEINYTFIFEFDTKQHLDYRQYLEASSLLS